MEKQEIHNKTILEKKQNKISQFKTFKAAGNNNVYKWYEKRTEITPDWQLKIHNYKSNKV